MNLKWWVLCKQARSRECALFTRNTKKYKVNLFLWFEEKCPHGCMCLNTLSLAGVAIWGMEPLWVESCWRKYITADWAVPHSQFTLNASWCGCKGVISQFPASVTTPACHLLLCLLLCVTAPQCKQLPSWGIQPQLFAKGSSQLDLSVFIPSWEWREIMSPSPKYPVAPYHLLYATRP